MTFDSITQEELEELRDKAKARRPGVMPSDVDEHVGFFDRFAEQAAAQASRAWFFAGCVLLVVVWAPSILLFGQIDLWQLVINTVTTIVTFLMVAILQNSEARANAAIQHKLNAIARALADSMDDADNAAELRAAVGLEERESTS